jgi:hypothetical protein
MDKPIINFAFDVPVDVPAEKSVRRFFERTDYKLVQRSGANIRAQSMDDLIEAINYYLDDPSLHAQQRAALVAEDVGILGDQSGSEIASICSRLINSSSEKESQ